MRRTTAWVAGGRLAAEPALAAGSAWLVLYLYLEKRPDASLLDPEVRWTWFQAMGAAVALLAAAGFSLFERPGRPNRPLSMAATGPPDGRTPARCTSGWPRQGLG